MSYEANFQMIHTTEYWDKLLVNIGKIKDDWEQGKNYSKKLKLFLMAFSESDRKKLVDFIYPNNHYHPNQINDHYDVLLKKPNAQYLQALREFYIGKSFIIEEYVANNSTQFSQLEKEKPFFALLKIINSDANILVNLLLMQVWNSKNIDETFNFTPNLSDDKITILRSEIDGVISAIKRKTKGKYQFNTLFSFKGNNIFWIEKQSSDKMLRAFSKNIRFKPSSDILFNINIVDNLFEIKCGNKSMLNTITEIIARRLVLELVYYGKEQDTQIDLNQFKTGMSTIPAEENDDDLGICEIGFNRMKISNSSPLIIPKRSGRDIRNTLNELNDEEIIDLKDIEAIDYIKILYRGSDKKVKFDRNKDGTLTLKFDDKYLNRTKVDSINNLFEKQFGLPLGQEIEEIDEKKILQNTYSLIFSSEIIDKISEVIKRNLLDLESKGLISYNGNKIYWCDSCKKTFSEVDRCPNCGNQLRYVLSKVKIIRKPQNILNFIKNRLKSNNFEIKDILVQRTYLNLKKNFIQIFVEKEIVYLYFNDGKDIKNMIDYFNHSNVPIVIINNSKRKIKGFDNGIFPQKALSDILLMNDTEFKQYFTETLSKVQEKIENIIIQSSDSSSERLTSYLNGQNSDYDETTLEDDAYNLMRYIFKTGEKWGKSVSGKTVPEGIIGYGFLRKIGSEWKTYRRSIIWDCKFTQGTQFDFNRYIKIQARDYVIRTSQSKAIKDHSKQLSAYISFTNNVNQTQYNNFAKKVKNIQDWNGNVVLFDLKALVKLHTLMKQNYRDLDNRRSQFYNDLTNLIRNPEPNKFYSLITEDKIAGLVNSVLQKEEDIPQLNYEETFLWLESDKIRIRG